jgi:hypothetical protein
MNANKYIRAQNETADKEDRKLNSEKIATLPKVFTLDKGFSKKYCA